MHHTPRTIALIVTLTLALALGASACSASDPGVAAAAAAPAAPAADVTATAGDVPLVQQITADFQGVQLDLVDGVADPGFTSMVFQEGSWAAMGTWKTEDEWCLAGVYDWAVTEATSSTEFTVTYARTQAFPECADAPADAVFSYVVTGAHRTGGRTVYEGSYVYPSGGGFDATRTVCGTTWDHPDRCGVATPGFAVPAPPAPPAASAV